MNQPPEQRRRSRGRRDYEITNPILDCASSSNLGGEKFSTIKEVVR
ncbi:hypothetical protein BRADI_4g06873v3 [Brachypodium distachyon]|uniref:Uncharacterized protein n=1 Tax=Brachypodium distachyon TaxID=15368 RepID=A0A0Q3L2C4_BRADI|nr:hypothetical protein BRADI_4g06873v3 [Brachypodium distachyon]